MGQSILKSTKRPVVKLKLWTAPDEKGRRCSFTADAAVSQTLHDLLLYSVAAPGELTDEFLDKAVAELKEARARQLARRLG